MMFLVQYILQAVWSASSPLLVRFVSSTLGQQGGTDSIDGCGWMLDPCFPVSAMAFVRFPTYSLIFAIEIWYDGS